MLQEKKYKITDEHLVQAGNIVTYTVVSTMCTAQYILRGISLY